MVGRTASPFIEQSGFGRSSGLGSTFRGVWLQTSPAVSSVATSRPRDNVRIAAISVGKGEWPAGEPIGADYLRSMRRPARCFQSHLWSQGRNRTADAAILSRSGQIEEIER